MKKIILIMALALSGLALSAQEAGDAAPAAVPVEDSVVLPGTEGADAVSLHSFSLQFAGLDYSYEQRLGGDFSMVFRAGFIPDEISIYSNTSGGQSLSFTSGLGVTVEPRYYTNFDRRNRLGKTTFKNSADFVALKITGGYSDVPIINLTPMYGIRRVWGEHWFGEFTTGVNVNLVSSTFGLHIQYRIGFVF